MKVVGVNGFGRIGRYFTRLTLDNSNVDVAVVNDLADVKTLAHLLKYDSVHRGLKHEFVINENTIEFSNGKKIVFLSERNPENIPWGKYGVEIVLESTGIFRTKELASKLITMKNRKSNFVKPKTFFYTDPQLHRWLYTLKFIN